MQTFKDDRAAKDGNLPIQGATFIEQQRSGQPAEVQESQSIAPQLFLFRGGQQGRQGLAIERRTQAQPSQIQIALDAGSAQVEAQAFLLQLAGDLLIKGFPKVAIVAAQVDRTLAEIDRGLAIQQLGMFQAIAQNLQGQGRAIDRSRLRRTGCPQPPTPDRQNPADPNPPDPPAVKPLLKSYPSPNCHPRHIASATRTTSRIC